MKNRKYAPIHLSVHWNVGWKSKTVVTTYLQWEIDSNGIYTKLNFAYADLS